ncbi:MAG: heavy metal translocating P-type ATPase [Gammaproteobacteria bacterium]|nr:heavy metal translocating P-type ATPase [Gammaproteobacteria bacterium]
MIIQTAALAALLFFGFKKAVTVIKGEYMSKEEAETAPTPVIVTDSSAGDGIAPVKLKTLPSAKTDSFRKTNIAALSALALSSAGFVFRPLNLLSLPFVLYAFKDLLKITCLQLKQGKVSAYTLVAIATAGTFFIPSGFFFSSLVAVVFIWSLKLTDTLTEKSRQDIAELFEKTPEYVWLAVDNAEIKTPYEQIKPGDILAVQAGNAIPADGIIVEGMAAVDQHVLTGESQPVEKEVGDTVFSSTILLSGKIHIKVERAGAETAVAKITSILNATVDFKSNAQMYSEKLSQALVIPALAGGAIAIPLLGFNGALAVINSHPKEKITFVGPISALNYLNIALRHNIVIKDGRSLELLNSVDTVVFDKTGTLTEEQPYVGGIYCPDHYYENEILVCAAAAESKQTHPLAKAILHEAEKRGIRLPPIDETECKLGYGVAVIIHHKTLHQKVHVGSARFMQVENLEIPPFLLRQQAHSQEQGYTLVMVAVDGEVCGGIELQPQIRPEAWDIIHHLKACGKRTCIISGDHETPTANLTKKLEIDEYFAQVLPRDKAEIIKKLQEQGRAVCYVGDGINDSIALKQAQVAVSLSGASTIAMDTAEVILMDKGLTHLPLLFDVAEKYKKNMGVTFIIMLIPAAIGVGGAFFLHYGLAQTIMLNILGLTGGIANAMLPALTNEFTGKEEAAMTLRTKTGHETPINSKKTGSCKNNSLHQNEI